MNSLSSAGAAKVNMSLRGANGSERRSNLLVELEIASGKEHPRNDKRKLSMAQFTTLTSRVMPLPVNDIDTDQIIPARFLKATDKNGMGDNLFADWRYNPDGSPTEDFILNKPESQGAQILLAGDNFGCGSSREHAPWALTAFGFRAVISTSFADIFRSNSLKNGLIPIIVDEETHKMLFDLIEEIPNAELTVDLESQKLILPNGSVNFPIDPFNKTCLLNGVDELGYILGFEKEIAEFETRN
jgi:3-isopropylmalate/(R)-2-methylmalate dehydratase small subunit